MNNVFKAGRVITPDSKWTGEEIEWHGWETWDVERFFKMRSRALNFYNYYLDASDLRPGVLDWMKRHGYTKDQTAAIKDAPPHALPTTVGKLIRCMDRGMPSLHPSAQDYFNELPFHETPPVAKDDATLVHLEIRNALQNITDSKYEAATATVTPLKAKICPLDRIRERVQKEVLPQLEECLESWGNTKTGAVTINMASLLRDLKIPAQGCKPILDWCERQHSEFAGALNREDPQLVQGYSCYSRPELKKIVKNLEVMAADIAAHGKMRNASRKPRIKKVKDATKQVSRLKYQMNSSDWNLDSVSPTRIPTAQCVLLFNTKTRNLGVYFANGTKGFEVKGTSLKDYDVTRSYACTLRKPKETLTQLLTAKTAAIEKVLQTIKSTRKKVNGRVNEQTVILKVIETKI